MPPAPEPLVAHVAPGQDLVQEGVHVGVVAEEALALAALVQAQLLGRPAPLGGQHALDHLLDRDVAEVQVGRQLRLPVQCRIIAIHAVIVQPVLQKRLQAKLGRLRARLQPAGFTYPAIEVQPGQQAFNFR